MQVLAVVCCMPVSCQEPVADAPVATGSEGRCSDGQAIPVADAPVPPVAADSVGRCGDGQATPVADAPVTADVGRCSGGQAVAKLPAPVIAAAHASIMESAHDKQCGEAGGGSHEEENAPKGKGRQLRRECSVVSVSSCATDDAGRARAPLEQAPPFLEHAERLAREMADDPVTIDEQAALKPRNKAKAQAMAARKQLRWRQRRQSSQQRQQRQKPNKQQLWPKARMRLE